MKRYLIFKAEAYIPYNKFRGCHLPTIAKLEV